jgi:hypothetical protein
VARDGDALDGAGFTVAGVPLWPVVSRPLLDLLAHYATFVERRAGAVREQLQRYDVDAVLVPFDGSPAVRLLVRVAQSLGIPTFVLNDGYKGDELQIEGMSTDVALAWSEAIREHYYARHPGPVLVTGNPKFSTVTPPARALRQDRPPRLLVGTFTFSPIDLNCRRSDAEDFLDQVLEGIAGALPSAASEVVVKLHPADEPAHYRELVARYPQLEVTLTSAGDVVELFAEADIYLTTYSTSLLEAARTMPVVYYRVNEQRLGPPFDGDEYLTPRTASTPGELTALLRDRDRLVAAPPAWIEHYLGPAGALERIVDAIEGQLRRGSPAAGARTAPDAARGA